MVSSAKNLEFEFSSLCINFERKPRMRSKSLSLSPRYLVKKRCFVQPSSRCVSKINLYPLNKFDVRAAKLELRNVRGRSSIIRPAKLNLKIRKSFLLKPSKLILPGEERVKKMNRFRTHLLTPTTSVASTNGKVFDEKSLSHTSFKSLISADDCIIQSFDTSTSSFKQLRSAVYPPVSTNVSIASPIEAAATATTMNKREDITSNSCLFQTRKESTVPTNRDDTSIDELASYFDLFVHIPKKMSSMAEMMYI